MNKSKRVTINDIARLAGVSKSTASLVLNGRGKELRVAESTRLRVLEVAKQEHYQPSIHARALNSSHSNTIGLVVPEMTNHGFAVFSHELEKLCRDDGLQLLIACTDENASQEILAVNNLIQRQVDGLIVASSMLSDGEYQKINQQLPVILFDRHLGESSLPLVITDAIEPTAKLIEHVASEGYDELYFFGGQPRISPTRDRLEGYKRGLQRAGVELQPEWVIYGHYHSSSGYELFADLCSRLGRVPQALFCAACGLQEGVLRYLSQHGLLESDIRLCSFDDHYLYDSLCVPIDTVAQDERLLAWNCFEMVTNLIKQRSPEPLQRWLPASIRLRANKNPR
ncbi:substrate-binding domain-containing protein [Winslowiella sp. 2C04]|uniref:substrate-binding domain-containing protein n=1 Tax=Winslowiella sp. 2C04 TaxID=3416179 RepID=UPI003CF57BF7